MAGLDVSRLAIRVRRGILVLVIAGLSGGFWGCAPVPIKEQGLPSPAPTGESLPSTQPVPTLPAKTATNQPTASAVIASETAPGNTEDGIDATQAREILPLQPAEVVAESIPGEIRIQWPDTGESLLYYQVFRKVSGSDDWSALDQVEASGEKLERYQYADRRIQAGVVYVYGVAAVNTLGATSLITQSDAVSAK